MQVASCRAVSSSNIVISVALFWGGGKRIKSERQVDRLTRRTEWLEGERERGKQQAQIRGPPGHPEIQKSCLVLLFLRIRRIRFPQPSYYSIEPPPLYAPRIRVYARRIQDHPIHDACTPRVEVHASRVTFEENQDKSSPGMVFLI